MDSFQIKAYAKINLGLDVLSRRPNGYHDVRMIMQTIRLYDKLTLRKTQSTGIAIKSNLTYLPNDDNNLVWRAANLFYQTAELTPCIHITLEKHIPIAAGLAGGSSDAAATLLAMNHLYGTGYSLEKLQEIGVQIGADVPYCLMRGTALSEGIGEVLTPLPAVPPAHCLVVKPPFSVSTKQVYEGLNLATAPHPNIDALLTALSEQNLSMLCEHLGNTLESVTIALHPEIAQIKAELLAAGALGTLMSGSGPTVFALFQDRKLAEKAYYSFKVGKYGKQTYLTSFFNPN